MHSAVGRDLLVEIMETLGAKCFPFRPSNRFIAVDTEALEDNDLKRASSQLKKHKLNAIVSTDGDRPLLIDETGTQINGDILGALTAKALDIDTIVTPLTSTSAIELTGWFKKTVYIETSDRELTNKMHVDIKHGLGTIMKAKT